MCVKYLKLILTFEAGLINLKSKNIMKKLLLSALVLSAGVASAQWTEQATGFNIANRGINQIDIVDANVVWAVAYDGADTDNVIQEFTRTTDGGATWIPGFIEMGDPALEVNNLSATTALKAWVSALDPALPTGAPAGSLFKTEDGGESWTFANPDPAAQAQASFTYPASFQNVTYFFDENNGLVQGDPVAAGPLYDYEIYTTTDGGATWLRVPGSALPNAANSSEYGYNGGNRGVGNLFWFVTNNGRIYRTTAATMNTTWEWFQSPISDFGNATTNGAVHFTNLDGTLAGATGLLIATTNGGTSYTKYVSTNGGQTWGAGTPYTAAYQNMDFIPGTTVLVATGDNGTAYTSAYSTDLGDNWIEIDTGEQRTSIAFLDGSTGWAGGFNQDATTGGIWKYTGAALGVTAVADRAQFTATPNPTRGMLQVANENANITDVVVYDLLGKQVYSGKFNALNQVDLDLTPLTAGAYILTATADNGAKQTIKIMKN
jgi:photosystem II stability/assembly factor-like uncharacterized protein